MNDGYNNKKVGLWTWLNKVSPWPLTYPIHMTRNESRYFTSWVKPSQYYLEFGCGGSTIKALKCSRALVYSVESNQSWLDELLSYRFMRIQAENLFILISVRPGNGVTQWKMRSSIYFQPILLSFLIRLILIVSTGY